jgi:hypothetical protein
MSLTSPLRVTDVRERFNVEFKKPRLVLSGQIAAPPTNPTRAHAALIGTAFDYVMRLHVSILSRSRVFARAWTAEAAVGQLASFIAAGIPIFPPNASRSTRGVVSIAQRIVRDARSEYDRCNNRKRISGEMLRYALLLGQLEQFFRCGILSTSFGRVKDLEITDLKNLLGVARRSGEPFCASRLCILDPAFQDASQFVGGADADLLIDDTLIEIKTSKELKFTAEAFRQLVGYYALLSMARGITDGPKRKPEIRSLGIYFARFGVFRSFPVASVIDARLLPAFIRWFRERAYMGRQRSRMIKIDGVTLEC